MKVGAVEWIGRPKNQPELLMGFTAMDVCDRCGVDEECSWINAENPRQPHGPLLLSIYLCRSCVWEALRRTYIEGDIDGQDLRARLTDRERQLIAASPSRRTSLGNAPRPHVRTMPRIKDRGQSVSLRFEVMKRDGYRCQLCGRTAQDGVRLEVDHKVPHSKGGLATLGNLWVLCWPCNRGKSDKDL